MQFSLFVCCSFAAIPEYHSKWLRENVAPGKKSEIEHFLIVFMFSERTSTPHVLSVEQRNSCFRSVSVFIWSLLLLLLFIKPNRQWIIHLFSLMLNIQLRSIEQPHRHHHRCRRRRQWRRWCFTEMKTNHIQRAKTASIYQWCFSAAACMPFDAQYALANLLFWLLNKAHHFFPSA